MLLKLMEIVLLLKRGVGLGNESKSRFPFIRKIRRILQMKLIKQIEENLMDDFNSLPRHVQSYLQEEMLMPSDIIGRSYDSMVRAKKIEILNRAEIGVRERCSDNDELVNSMAYFIDIAGYLIDRVNANTNFKESVGK